VHRILQKYSPLYSLLHTLPSLVPTAKEKLFHIPVFSFGGLESFDFYLSLLAV
jgi:hypothetical protein